MREDSFDALILVDVSLRPSMMIGESRNRGVVAEVDGAPGDIPESALRLDHELKPRRATAIRALPARASFVVASEPSVPELARDDVSPVRDRRHYLANGSPVVDAIDPVVVDGRLGNQPEEPAPVPYDPAPVGTTTRTPSGRDNKSVVMKGGAASSELPDLSAETWQLAPIRWAGNTSTTGNYFQAGESGKSLTIFNNLNLQANSFIMAPYIAQWSGMLGASSTGTTFTPSTGTAVKSDSSAMSFGGSVNVFPLSRFPFSGNLSRSTSMSRSAETASPSTSTAVGMRQQYRTEDGRDNYAFNFNRNNVTTGISTATNNSVVSSFGGSYTTSNEFEFGHFLEGNHNLSANFNGSSSASNPSTQDAKQFSANLNHGWNVHEDLSINNMLTFAKSDVNFFQGNTPTQNNSTVLLGTTGFTWRPFEDLPLTLTGGGNFSRTQTLNNQVPSDLNSLNGFLSTMYRFNNNLSATGNASISSVDSSGVRSISSVQAASVSYSGDPLQFSGFTYGWGTGGGLTHSSSSNGTSEVGSGVNASHNLSRAIIFGDYGAVNLSASQNVSHTTAQLGATTSLSNSVGAAWRASYGEQLTANLSTNVSFNTSSGVGGKNQFKTANLMGGGIYQISSRAAVTINANLTWSQSLISTSTNQVLNGLEVNTNTPQSTGSFSLGYTHHSPFSIRNLNYSGTLMRFQSFSNQNVAGVGALQINDKGSTSIQQLVDYRLGRLIFRLSNSWIDQAGKKSASIFGSVTREFDGFFDGRW
ncbi:MAG: hypothetical protein HZA62_13340 [Rhodocyclales bacterium]|nr:hypothetical protein [Rhodocyclales bacterium]